METPTIIPHETKLLYFFSFLLGLTLAGSISVAYISWACIFLIYFVSCWRDKEWPKVFELPFFWIFLLYAGWGLAVSLLGFSVKRSLDYWRADLLCVLFWNLYLVFKKWPDTQRWAIRGFLSGFIFLAVVGLAQFALVTWFPGANDWLLTQAPKLIAKFALRQEDGLRVHAHIHTLSYAEVLTMAAIFVLGFHPTTPRSHNQQGVAGSAFVRWWGHGRLFLVVKALFLGAVFASASRGPFVAYLAGVAAYILGGWKLQRQSSASQSIGRRGGFRLAASLALALSVLALSPMVRERFLHGLSLSKNQDRLTMWKVSLIIIKKNPVFGVGIAHVRSLWKDYFPKEWVVFMSNQQEVWSDVHNLYLQQACERGIPGLGILLILLVGFPVMFWRLLKNTQTRDFTFDLTLSAWAVCVAFLVMNVTESAFQDSEVVFTLFFILALVLARPKSISHDPTG